MFSLPIRAPTREHHQPRFGPLATVSQDAVVTVLADFDKDRMADLWEAANGFATNNAADASIDGDGDGLSNWQDAAGTNPAIGADRFKLEGRPCRR